MVRRLRALALWGLVLAGLMPGCLPARGKPATINSGVVWHDTAGQVIQAHGLGMLQVGKTFYWYGEDRQDGKLCQAIRCYASTDLQHWQFRNVVFSSQANPTLPPMNLERPKVLYCDATRKYVMWVHKENTKDYDEARALVAACDTPDGQFVYQKDFQPMGNMSRDCTLFKDDDGAGYFFSSANNNADLMCYQLTPDFLDVARVWTVFKGKSREAPAIFKRNGRYYLITSGCTSWGPNCNLVASAANVWGPYGKQAVLCQKDTWNTYCSQSTFVLPIKGTKATNFVFMSDRWKGWRLADSRYIFLPIPFGADGTMLPVQWGDEWELNVETGECAFPVTPVPAANNIAKGCPVTASMGNQLNGNEARSAVDGDPRTRWCADDGDYPHWLSVDLGAPQAVTRSEIQWERRDGTVYFYRVEASLDGLKWTTVADRSSNTSTSQTQVDDFAVNARYFRLQALGCQPPSGGYAWASVMEWRLLAGGTNVALDKTATADSEQKGSYGAKGNDGMFSSVWQTGSGKPDNWWKVDLGAPHSLTGCRIMWQDPGFLYQYKIEVSPDDAQWETVVDMTQNTRAAWLPAHAFMAKKARFVKVSATGIEDGCWLGIREFEVFDTLPLPPASESRPLVLRRKTGY
ncbi:MAG: discoidin domain-containing protein [Candidatus Sumerlaeota bacterium]|nr:discoidin domain-containing protein [Candidatus Sumerlaeota bacterium]